jgi:hypothetical protein
LAPAIRTFTAEPWEAPTTNEVVVPPPVTSTLRPQSVSPTFSESKLASRVAIGSLTFMPSSLSSMSSTFLESAG